MQILLLITQVCVCVCIRISRLASMSVASIVRMHFCTSKDLILPVLTGPEFGGQKNCVYIGMVTEDLDVSELVETIAATGREIEENSRVCINKSQSISAPFIFSFPYWLQDMVWFFVKVKIVLSHNKLLITVEVINYVHIRRTFVTGF